MGSFAKDCLQPLVNRISIKTLEKYWPSHTLSYSSKLNDLTRNKSGGAYSHEAPRFRHLWAYITPSFAGHSFHVISDETRYYLPIQCCSLWFVFHLKYIFVSLCMYNSRIKLLKLIRLLKFDDKPENFDCEKDWAEWHNWQKSQGNSHQQTHNQL